MRDIFINICATVEALKEKLNNIAHLQSGLFAKPSIQADTLYLQGIHFNEFGEFDRQTKPQLKSDNIAGQHLLQKDNILFAAKGLNNFAVVYNPEIGKAVASSSFIVIRLYVHAPTILLPHYLAWYLGSYPEVKLFHKQMGSTIPSISITKLSDLEIEIPSIEQQERIIHIQSLRNHEKQIVRQLEERKDQLIKRQLLNAVKNNQAYV